MSEYTVEHFELDGRNAKMCIAGMMTRLDFEKPMHTEDEDGSRDIVTVSVCQDFADNLHFELIDENEDLVTEYHIPHKVMKAMSLALQEYEENMQKARRG